MNLSIEKTKEIYNKKYKQNLSFWDLVFWQNFPLQINDKNKISNIIKINEKLQLAELKKLTLQNFVIESKDNKGLDLRIKGILETAYQSKDFSYFTAISKNIENFKCILAEIETSQNFSKYLKLICYLEKNNYPETFQCLILNEYLTQLYKLDTINGKTEVERQQRKLNKSIFGILELNEFQLDFIFNMAENLSKNNADFGEIYLQSYLAHKEVLDSFLNEKIERFKDLTKVGVKQLQLKKGDLNLKVNTFNKGAWVKFDCYEKDKQNYIKNAECLSHLVYNTNSCLKNNAEQYLKDGDVYVFIDNEKNAHIIITMYDNEMWEVRGVDGGQEIEKNYIDVALEFLDNNNYQDNIWKKRILVNKQLIEYKEQLQNNNFNFNNFDSLLKAMSLLDKKFIDGDNPNIAEIKLLLPKFTQEIAKYFGCKEDEIIFGDFNEKNIDKIDFDKIKVILGKVDFRDTKIKSLGAVEMIYKANFEKSKIKRFPNLKKCTMVNGVGRKKLPEQTQVEVTDIFHEKIIM